MLFLLVILGLALPPFAGTIVGGSAATPESAALIASIVTSVLMMLVGWAMRGPK